MIDFDFQLITHQSVETVNKLTLIINYRLAVLKKRR